MTNEPQGKTGWNISAGDASTARRYHMGQWSGPVNVQVAQLDLLQKIEGHLDRIRFRVGFLALMVLLSILATLFILFSSLTALSQF